MTETVAQRLQARDEGEPDMSDTEEAFDLPSGIEAHRTVGGYWYLISGVSNDEVMLTDGDVDTLAELLWQFRRGRSPSAVAALLERADKELQGVHPGPWADGWRAHVMGRHTATNPYQGINGLHWLDGWRKAEKHAKRVG